MSPQAAALLAELAPEADAVSAHRLAKRLGWPMSAVLREAALLGSAPLGGRPGPGWVHARVEADGRWMLALTPAGRAAA